MATVFARAAELISVEEPAPEVKAEPAAEAWAGFVAGLRDGSGGVDGPI